MSRSGSGTWCEGWIQTGRGRVAGTKGTQGVAILIIDLDIAHAKLLEVGGEWLGNAVERAVGNALSDQVEAQDRAGDFIG